MSPEEEAVTKIMELSKDRTAGLTKELFILQTQQGILLSLNMVHDRCKLHLTFQIMIRSCIYVFEGGGAGGRRLLRGYLEGRDE